jgi:hypothetical protein
MDLLKIGYLINNSRQYYVSPLSKKRKNIMYHIIRFPSNIVLFLCPTKSYIIAMHSKTTQISKPAMHSNIIKISKPAMYSKTTHIIKISKPAMYSKITQITIIAMHSKTTQISNPAMHSNIIKHILIITQNKQFCIASIVYQTHNYQLSNTQIMHMCIKYNQI